MQEKIIIMFFEDYNNKIKCKKVMIKNKQKKSKRNKRFERE